jgi:lipoprotein-anchoring transpeptidase ErfK/SrfK
MPRTNRTASTLALLAAALAAGLSASACSPPTGPKPPPRKPTAPQVEAAWTAARAAPDPRLIRAEVLLGRARFSPGAIDGRPGENERHALAAFQAAHGLPITGDLDDATWAALTRDSGPVVQRYTITPADVAGPFAPDVGENFLKLARLPAGPQYPSPQAELAERFHMTPALLAALNPAADFGRAGTVITVAAPGAPAFARGDVARIEVSKAREQVTAFGADGRVLAVYPATVGSAERPSPTGAYKVKGVGWNPDYVYDPRKLHWGPRRHGRLTIKPGPKNPVGMVWIDLNAPSYGIHGAPNPARIGKTASHGCVRLTNWDAVALARGVKPGVPVDFVGVRPGRTA